MKLLYITNGICGSGGLERVLSVKASALAEDYGYEVVIATLNEDHHRPFYTFSPQVKFRTFRAAGQPLNYILQYRSTIKQLVKEVQPDVISVCDDGLKGFFIPKILGKKIPIIYERHASQVLNYQKSTELKEKIQLQLMRHLAGNFNRLVLLTEGNRKEWTSDNIAIIQNPVSFVPEQNAKLTSKKIISVGSQGYNKGTDLLLKIWQQIHNEHPDWQLHHYGKSTADRTYEQMARELQLNNVFFHLPTAEIEQCYLDSSVCVLSSRSEGFGMVLIEAMACGVPVISFDCPHGPGDIITNGEDGFLIDNGNTELFAEKLSSLMSDATHRKKMGAAAKNNAKRYLPGEIIRQWHQLFKSLLS